LTFEHDHSKLFGMAELEDWRILVGLFPSSWEQLGRSSGAVRRLRGFPSLESVLRTLLLHVGCGWSLRETAVQAKLAGLAEISDVTLLNRLRDAEAWLRQLCELLLREQGVDLESKIAGRRVRLLDATVVSEPGPTGSQWRIHYSLRLPTLECDHFILTSTRGTGAAERFANFHFHPQELVLADAGYSNPPGIQAIREPGAEVCVRLNPHALPLYNQAGEGFDLPAALAALERVGEAVEWPVWVQSGQHRMGGRLCAIRKSQAAIQRAELRLRDKVQRGKSVGPLTRLCAQYVLVFTTLAAQEASAARVLQLYRLRWQVELSFKRLKSIAQLGHLPKYDDRSSRAWLYGKLFLALLTEKMTRMARTVSPWGYSLPPAQDTQQVA
jgi:Transposase DDE domain